LDELACRNHCRVAENSDQIALAAAFDAQHAEAVIRVMKGQAVDQARQNLG